MLTPDFDFVSAARQCGVQVALYWRMTMAPRLAVCHNQHTVRELKRRACRTINSIIPVKEEHTIFMRLLNDINDKSHARASLRHKYGISREYISIRMLTLLERHIAADKPMPYPLNKYMAVLVPNRIPDSRLSEMIGSGEFPNTLRGFRRDEHIIKSRYEAMATEAKAIHRAARDKRAKRWKEPFAKYLDRKQQRHMALVAARAQFIMDNAATPNLKAFAQFCAQANPPTACSRKFKPGAYAAYIRTHIDPYLQSKGHYVHAVPALTALYEQAEQYAQSR